MEETEEGGKRSKEVVVPGQLRLALAWTPYDQRWVPAGHLVRPWLLSVDRRFWGLFFLTGKVISILKITGPSVLGNVGGKGIFGGLNQGSSI